MKRQFRATSKEGEQFIKPFKPNHKQKILEGLERLRIGGTHEEIAVVCGLRPDQVWKRLSEAVKDGTIFDTGITRRLKSGIAGIVWQRVGLKPVEATAEPKTQEQQKSNKILKQFDLLKQSALFQ